MTQLHSIPRHEVIDVWPQAMPYIERVLENCNDDFSVSGILGSIVDGDYQLWIGYDGPDIDYVGVTRLEYFGEKLIVLVMWLAGDDMHQWLETATAELESWAIDIGAEELRITGRPGWERIFKKDGFRKTHTILAKPLGEKQ